MLRVAALQRYGGTKAPLGYMHALDNEGRVEGRAVTAADVVRARKSLALPTVRVTLRADTTQQYQ